MEVSLTLAVPTFNRADDAARLAGQIAAWIESSGGAVSAVFYDDGSTDDTYTRLQAYEGPGLRVVRAEANQGYARTFLRALTECDTEWVMLVADDDVLTDDDGQRADLLAWLRAEQPDFVCTQWLTSDGGLYRGQSAHGPITDDNLRVAASHAPGLIYRSSSVRSTLPLLVQQLDDASDAALVYPQVVLVAQMLAADCTARYWGGSVIHEGSALPSGITDVDGRTYWSPESRLAQGFAFDRLYRQMAKDAPSRQYRAHCRAFREDNDVRLAKALHRILRAQLPDDMERLEIMATVARSSLRLLGPGRRRRVIRSASTP